MELFLTANAKMKQQLRRFSVIETVLMNSTFAVYTSELVCCLPLRKIAPAVAIQHSREDHLPKIDFAN